MTGSEHERFADILHAIERCQDYTQHLASDELRARAYDAGLRNVGVQEYLRVDAELILASSTTSSGPLADRLGQL